MKNFIDSMQSNCSEEVDRKEESLSVYFPALTIKKTIDVHSFDL